MMLAFLGLGKMGIRMAEKLLAEGHTIIAWNRTYEVAEEFNAIVQNSKFRVQNPKAGNLIIKKSVEEAINALDGIKIVWSMLPSGEPTQAILDELGALLSPGDIIIDGGNSFYKDTQRRSEELGAKGIEFLGIGVSGGIIAEKEGYPMMVGGDREAYDFIVPLLDSLSKPHGGHTYFGPGGAGHFVKMVHNGIEYGMMQAIGEGFGVLEKSPYDLNLLDIAKNWQHGTIVDSFLIDRAHDALEKDGKLSDIIGEIDANGEGEWTINQAKEEGVPIENIEQSLDFRRRSKSDAAIRDSFAARMVAALRNEFGGHAVKKR